MLLFFQANGLNELRLERLLPRECILSRGRDVESGGDVSCQSEMTTLHHALRANRKNNRVKAASSLQ